METRSGPRTALHLLCLEAGEEETGGGRVEESLVFLGLRCSGEARKRKPEGSMLDLAMQRSLGTRSFHECQGKSVLGVGSEGTAVEGESKSKPTLAGTFTVKGTEE